MKTKEITEIRNDYTNEDRYTHIDVWEGDDEQGRTVAVVCLDTKKVFYIDNAMRGHDGIERAIKEAIEGADMETALNGLTNPIEKIDWSEMRNQKGVLISLMGSEKVTTEERDEIDALVATIDDIQEYAMDILGIKPEHLYDFEMEEYLGEISKL